MQPFSYDAENKRLTCAECGEPVNGILLPIRPEERPRTYLRNELLVDVVVDSAGGIIQPCGHEYRLEQPQQHRVTHARASEG